MAGSEHISWFADIGLLDRPRVGGKGGSLGELQRAGIAVPPGFVVTTVAFDRFMQVLDGDGQARAAVEALSADDLEGISACTGKLRERIEATPLPEDVLSQIAGAHDALCKGGNASTVAVRSSATT